MEVLGREITLKHMPQALELKNLISLRAARAWI